MRKVIIIQVYWLHAHQVTVKFISRVRKVVIVRVYWLLAHQVTLRFTSFHYLLVRKVIIVQVYWLHAHHFHRVHKILWVYIMSVVMSVIHDVC